MSETFDPDPGRLSRTDAADPDPGVPAVDLLDVEPVPSAVAATPVVAEVQEEPTAWPLERILVLATRIVILVVTTVVAVRTVQPSLVLTNNTPTGGDMGAHVWGPAYLRDHLLNHGKLNGWTMDWYSGFPIYRFYMVVPALLIVLLDVVLPYGVAFKMVAVLGVVTLPVCAWAFGRLARLPFPVPELFAVGGLVFLLDESYTIYGGNIASTMAGEFSFSIALSLAVLGFGLMANGLQTGRRRATTAVVIALAVLCHGLVAIFVVVGLVLMGLVYLDRPRLRYFVTTCSVGALLSAFWIVPFFLNHAYMTDMKYKGEPGSGSFDSYWDMFFALPAFFDVLFTTLAVIGLLVAVVRRQLVAAWLGITGVVFAGFVFLFRDSLPVIGLLWNPRLLPFVNLCRYLLAMYAVSEIAQGMARSVARARYIRSVQEVASASGPSLPAAALPEPPRESSWVLGVVTAGVVLLASLGVLGFRFQELPGGKVVQKGDSWVYRWGIGPLAVETAYGKDGFVDGWARWNFSGYEGKAYYGEYHDLVQTMKRLGEDPAHGCGRALWENYSDNDKYGTSMALMLLPFWTDSCIGSSEGLFFEASGTTPYHFLAAAAMSKQSSNPVRELRYTNNDAAVGVPYLQDLGMRYYLAVTPEAIAQADQQAGLQLVTTSGPWHIYEVVGGDIVTPLATQPVVVKERSGDQRERWLEVGTSWFQNRGEWAAVPAADGPDSWQRIDVDVDMERRVGEPGADNRQVDVVVPREAIDAVPLDAVTVSDVEVGDDSVSFSVDRPGVPVLVRVSYFPNWDVEGAEGPYRVAPNMMVVVPTGTEVRMSFGGSGTDVLAYLMTILGLVLLVVLWRRGPVDLTPAAPTVVVPHDHRGTDGEIAAPVPPSTGVDPVSTDAGPAAEWLGGPLPDDPTPPDAPPL